MSQSYVGEQVEVVAYIKKEQSFSELLSVKL